MTAVIEELDLRKLMDGELVCQVTWDSTGKCTNPATHLVFSHDMKCINAEEGICSKCLARAIRLGFMDPHLGCGNCGDAPYIKWVRPI